MNRYRIIYFVPCLTLEWRVPIAVIVDSPDHGIGLLDAGVPPAAAVGGDYRQAVCRLVLDIITNGRRDEPRAFDYLPRAVNKLAVLGEPGEVPPVVNPLEWLRTYVLPEFPGMIGR